jgi:uncharacterized membrane protein
MVLIKILKRRDASSVLVAILLAIIIQPILATLAHLAAVVSNLNSGQYPSGAYPGTGWKGEYLYPVVLAVLQIILLEVLAWIFIWMKPRSSK